MRIPSILFSAFPSVLVTAALAGCAVGPDAIDDESVEQAASAAASGRRPHVLVANSRGGNVVGFAENGAPLGDFIPAGRGGLSDPDTVIRGPDGRLYVSSGAEVANLFIPQPEPSPSGGAASKHRQRRRGCSGCLANVINHGREHPDRRRCAERT